MTDEIKRAYTAEAKIYDGSRFESKVGRYYYEIERSRILEWLKGPKILELGCGTGRYIVPFSKLGFDCTGIDITPAMLEVAKQKAKKIGVTPKLLIMDAHDLEFEDETFDSVFCDRTFKMFRDPIRALREAHRVLKPHGRIIIDAEINRELTGKILDNRFIGRLVWILTMTRETPILKGRKPPPEKFYTKEELKTIVRHVGFEVLECRRLLWLPTPLAWLLPDFILEKLKKKTLIERIRGPKLLAVGEK